MTYSNGSFHLDLTKETRAALLKRLEDNEMEFVGVINGLKVFSSKQLPQGEARLYDRGVEVGRIIGLGK